MDDDGFIGLPPGMAPIPVDPDSGTVRRERNDKPRTTRGEEIVFFPAAPGVPVEKAVEPGPQTAEPQTTEPQTTEPQVTEPQTTEPFGRAELDDATRASAPRRHAAAAWQVVVDGRAVPVEGFLYLGRNPVATAAHPGAPVLQLDDSTKSVSKTHALLEVEGDALWVHDLDSTNGVWVSAEGADPVEVVPGQRAGVPAGSELELGDLVIRVEQG